MVIGLGLGILATFVWLIVGLLVIGYALYSIVDGGNDPQEDNSEQPPEDQPVVRDRDTEV